MYWCDKTDCLRYCLPFATRTKILKSYFTTALAIPWKQRFKVTHSNFHIINSWVSQLEFHMDYWALFNVLYATKQHSFPQTNITQYITYWSAWVTYFLSSCFFFFFLGVRWDNEASWLLPVVHNIRIRLFLHWDALVILLSVAAYSSLGLDPKVW